MTLPIRNGRVRTPQGTFFWREVGYGPTLLLLHSTWHTSHQWVSFMTQLGSQFHCLAPDLLGFGESSHLPLRNYTIDAQVTGLHNYLSQLRVSPDIIVADTLGAWVALRYCLHYPDAVRQLILFAPEGVSHPQLDRRWERDRWLAGSWAPRFWCVQTVAPLIRVLGSDRWLQTIRQRRQQLRSHPASCRLLFQRHKTALQTEWVNAALPQLQTPVYLLEPEQIPPTIKHSHQMLQELAPDVQRVSFPGDEHSLWNLAAERLPQIVRESALGAIAP